MSLKIYFKNWSFPLGNKVYFVERNLLFLNTRK